LRQQLVKAEKFSVLKFFFVSVVCVSYLEGEVLIVAVRYRSIVVAVQLVSATCLLKIMLSS